MKKQILNIIFLIILFLISSCSSILKCKRLSEENLIYVFSKEKNILEIGGDYINNFGNVLIENCNLKKGVITFDLRVLDIYGKEKDKSNLKVYQFEKENNEFKKKFLLKETNESSFQIKIAKFKEKQKLLVFKFNNNWNNIIVKRI